MQSLGLRFTPRSQVLLLAGPQPHMLQIPWALARATQPREKEQWSLVPDMCGECGGK